MPDQNASDHGATTQVVDPAEGTLLLTKTLSTAFSKLAATHLDVSGSTYVAFGFNSG
jgi:hypothetical protein